MLGGAGRALQVLRLHQDPGSRNGIGWIGASMLANALMGGEGRGGVEGGLQLVVLDVANNNIGEEGLEALAPALLTQTRLQTLDLTGNHVAEGIFALADYFVDDTPAPYRLSPSGTGSLRIDAAMGHAGCGAVCVRPSRHFRADAPVAGATWPAAHESETRRGMDVTDGGATQDLYLAPAGGGEEVVEAERDTRALLQLRELRLKDNGLSGEHIKSIVPLLRKLAPSLRELDLSCNPLSTASLASVCQALTPTSRDLPIPQAPQFDAVQRKGEVEGKGQGGGDSGYWRNRPTDQIARWVGPEGWRRRRTEFTCCNFVAAAVAAARAVAAHVWLVSTGCRLRAAVPRSRRRERRTDGRGE